MKMTWILIAAACALAACSTARQEPVTESQKGNDPVVSYFAASDEAAAQAMMAQQCGADGYRILSTEDRVTGNVLIHGSSKPLTRTFVSYTCGAKANGSKL